MGHTSFATCLKLPSHLYIPHLRYLEILLSTKMSISRAFRCRWCPSGVPDSTLWDRADPCFCSSASPGKWARWTPPPLTPSHLASLPSQGAHLFLLRPVLDRQASRGHRNLLVFLTSRPHTPPSLQMAVIGQQAGSSSNLTELQVVNLDATHSTKSE